MPNVYCAVDSCEFSDSGKCKKDSVRVNANAKVPDTTTGECTACASYSPKKC